MPNGIDSNTSTRPATPMSPLVPSDGVISTAGPEEDYFNNGDVPPRTNAHTGNLRALNTRTFTFVSTLHGQCLSQPELDSSGYKRPQEHRDIYVTPSISSVGATVATLPGARARTADPQLATDDALIQRLYDSTLDVNVAMLRELRTKVEADPVFRDACRDIFNAWRGLTSMNTWKAATAGAASMTAAHAAALLLLAMFQSNPVMRAVAVTQPFVAMKFLQSYLKERLGYVDPDPGNRAPPSDNIRAANSLVNWNAVQPFLDNILKSHPFIRPVVKTLVSGTLQAGRDVAEHTQTAVGLGRLPDDAPAGPRKPSDFENAVVDAMTIAIRGMPDLHYQILKTATARELEEIMKASGPVQRRIIPYLRSPNYIGGMSAVSGGIGGQIKKAISEGNESRPTIRWQPGPPRVDELSRGFEYPDPNNPFE